MRVQYTRRDLLRTLGAGALAYPIWSAAQPAGESKRPPNVVLVLTDDQGYPDLGCHGNPLIKTPVLDQLYTQSVRMTNFHVCPTCTPTRAALMTGHYSLRTGVWHTIMGRSLMRRDEVTMGDVFSANGYATGIFGKWHLGDNYPFRPQDRGFQEVFVHGGGGVGQAPDYWGNDYFDDTYFHNGTPEQCTGYCSDVWFDAAQRFIEAHREHPFFVYLPTNAPHAPYRVPEQYAALYRDKEVVSPEFYGMITNLDENMGRLLETLKRLDLEENTILIFVTDNGSSAAARLDKEGFAVKGYNAGMRGMKGSPYDGGHRVACFLRWPGGKLDGGRDIGRLTAGFDLLPTLIDLCDMQPPEQVRFDGVSLKPLLTENPGDWPERTLFVDTQRLEHPVKGRNAAVMSDRWRLIDGAALFDMAADPEQRNNIAAAHPETVAQLRAAYDAWWADISTRFDEYCEIVLGDEHENPTRLCSMDWHGENVPWNQDAVRAGMEANGFWAVDVARDGDYEIALRRWPIEAGLKMNAAPPDGVALNITQARLRIGDFDATQAVSGEDSAAVFRVPLKAGKTTLQTWLTDAQGLARGAYYVYVTRY